VCHGYVPVDMRSNSSETPRLEGLCNCMHRSRKAAIVNSQGREPLVLVGVYGGEPQRGGSALAI
jgi:hypothetical protein